MDNHQYFSDYVEEKLNKYHLNQVLVKNKDSTKFRISDLYPQSPLKFQSLNQVEDDDDKSLPSIKKKQFSFKTNSSATIIKLPSLSQAQILSPVSPKLIHFEIKKTQRLQECKSPKRILDLSYSQSKTTKRKMVNYSKSMSQQEIIKNFLNNKYAPKEKQFTKRQSTQLNGIARLEYEGQVFFDRILKDDLLGDIFIKVLDKDRLRTIHKRVLGQIFQNNFHVGHNQLVLAHRSLDIHHRHFNRMKYYYILSLLELKTSTPNLFQVTCNIESYRESVLGQDTIVQQLGGEKGVNQVAKVMYGKIFADYILGIFFKDIDLDTQAYKFSRLFSQILNTSDSPNYSLDIMRERHVKYGLTYIHFAYFKLYLAQALYELNAGLEKIVLILSILDGYKCSVLNEDSIEDLIIDKFGSFNKFCEAFVANCYRDQVLAPLLQTRGYERFLTHSKNMFFYLFNRHLQGITFRDLRSIHQIQSHIFNAVRNQTMILINKIVPTQNVLEDFVEQWDELENLLIKRKFPYQQAGGWDKVKKFNQVFISHIKQQSAIMSILTNYEMTATDKCVRFTNFVFRGLSYYKKTDIQIIHQRLKINDELYDVFIHALKLAINEFDPKMMWILDIVNIYREYVVQS